MRLDRLYRDVWRCAIVQAPIAAALDPVQFAQAPYVFLPDRGDRAYAADPFGLWRDNHLTVFVEHFDFHNRHGVIAAYHYDAALTLLDTREVLRLPWHVSFPLVFEHDGAALMLPEQSLSGHVSLYRAQEYPWRWTPHAHLLDFPLVDVTLFQQDDAWWLLGTPPNRLQSTHLLAFSADALTGPYRAHPGNPVICDQSRARPAGTVFGVDGALYLPTMDCRSTYGAAVTINRLDRLSAIAFETTPVSRIEASLWSTPYRHGLHMLSAAGPSHTLIDVKQRHFDPVDGAIRTVWQLIR